MGSFLLLARRPGHIAAAQNMEMQMVDGLPSLLLPMGQRPIGVPFFIVLGRNEFALRKFSPTSGFEFTAQKRRPICHGAPASRLA